MFQFTHPGKGATSSLLLRWGTGTFQFTHPGKGATGWGGVAPPLTLSFNSRTLGRVRPVAFCYQKLRKEFQFTHPGKGATPSQKYGQIPVHVSIHAPWEGCDRAVVITSEMSICVSIHAPWEGCDRNTLELLNTNLQFQFTHPGKGATHSVRDFDHH